MGLWAWEERVEFLATVVEQAVKETDWMDTGAKISWSSLNSVQAWQEAQCQVHGGQGGSLGLQRWTWRKGSLGTEADKGLCHPSPPVFLTS